jgi:hypothetical protein
MEDAALVVVMMELGAVHAAEAQKVDFTRQRRALPSRVAHAEFGPGFRLGGCHRAGVRNRFHAGCHEQIRLQFPGKRFLIVGTCGRKVILPIWHKITKDDLLTYGPPLADRVAVVTQGKNVRFVASALADVLRED